jgi:hypothetical protein
MSAATARRRPLAAMWAPPARWSEHLCMFVVRDTRGCELAAHEQLNRYPADPYCSLTWMLEGRSQLVAQGDAARSEILPRHFVNGCQTRPCVSRNLGDRHSFCVVFHPDAFRALFGVDLAAIQDAFVDASRRLVVDAFMARHATSLGTSPWTRLRRMGVNVGLQVAGGLMGVGPRQVQRLARREGGLNVPGLSRLWRSERSMHRVRETLARGQAIDWAAHAAEAGYADQSHLVRECKEFSGRTPAQIVQQARHDEADWFYRL